MHNVKLVDVLDSGDYLLKVLARLILIDSCLLDNVVEELSAICVLHNQVQLLWSLNDFIKLNYIRMSNQLQYMDLPRYPFDVGNVGDSLFLEDFNSDLVSGENMRAKLDFSKRAFSDCFS